ncbi:hypothetical protein E3T55_03030 [Cryobacterium frigoriphilum]|uniref:Uncharacterized protein n=1 Tax=Cryobacterium frigoriphilum TaxID=1259150 RepID=A0A4R9A9M4_9MICO|nr:hypothetical protein [Cryobacterium frigoriphilum]TFD54427.1 hypothetical protein E3T55_03030 [Cryobacterium frigoriphilum]
MKAVLVVLTTIFAVVSVGLNLATFTGSQATANYGFLSVIITLGLLVTLLLVGHRTRTKT